MAFPQHNPLKKKKKNFTLCSRKVQSRTFQYILFWTRVDSGTYYHKTCDGKLFPFLVLHAESNLFEVISFDCFCI